MNEPLVCEDCGTSDPKREVERTVCPYEKEIRDRDVPVVLCADCYRERVYET